MPPSITQVSRYWLWLQHTQWMKREQLEKVQNRKLREMVYHAANKVPFYRGLYESVGVDPGSIRESADLPKLPTVTKQQIRSTPLRNRTAVDVDVSSCTLRTTSGSTGMPLAILDDSSSASYRVALWIRRFWVYGITATKRACIVVPGETRKAMIFDTKGPLGFVMGRNIRTLSLANDMREHIRLISEWKPDAIVGPPSFFRALIRSADEAGKSLRVKTVMANAETLDGATRKHIADKLHTDDVFEVYGAVEAGPLAWECPTHSGYHINAESVIIEFLRNGEPVAPGESGELCITNLFRKPTPMIRYMLGDAATPIDTDCGCGRGLPLMKEKLGRTLDFIVTKEGRYISPFQVMYSIEDVPGIIQYKVTQKEDYSIEVLVIPSKPGNERLFQELEERCRRLFGQMPISTKGVEEIETDRGRKFRIVESNAPK